VLTHALIDLAMAASAAPGVEAETADFDAAAREASPSPGALTGTG